MNPDQSCDHKRIVAQGDGVIQSLLSGCLRHGRGWACCPPAHHGASHLPGGGIGLLRLDCLGLKKQGGSAP